MYCTVCEFSLALFAAFFFFSFLLMCAAVDPMLIMKLSELST